MEEKLNPRPEILSSPLLKGLTKEQLEIVLSKAKVISIKKGQILFQQDEPCKHTFLMQTGRLKLHQLRADGSQTLIRVLEPGQLIAVVSALKRETYPGTATAERNSEVLRWDGGSMEDLFFKVPMLCRNTLAIVSARVQEMQLRFAELAVERTERRIARALLRLAAQVGLDERGGIAIDLSLSKQDLAEMVGTTLFTVSRILTEWKKKEWVRLGRQKISLTQPQILRQIAEEEL